MEKISLYLRESYDELMNHVTWPTWASLQETTVIVLVTTLICALIIFIMDAISNSALNFIY